MQLNTLSPADFENLSADVLTVSLGVRFERFGEGQDGGVDCQYCQPPGEGDELWIGQAKRYSDVNSLFRVMPAERGKMEKLPRQPARYFLVTSCSLLPQHKEKLVSIMSPYIKATGDIYGEEDIEAILKQNRSLYARHHRLWLHSIEQLKQEVYAASFTRSASALEHIHDQARNFVHHPQVVEIESKLAAHHACLVVGDPGSGKTTTVAEIALKHYLAEPALELHWFSDRSFDEALHLLRPGCKQLFVLDDFLGATFLSDEAVFKNRQSWNALLREAKESCGALKLLFTTRDYILQQALNQMEQTGQFIAQLTENNVRVSAGSAVFRVDFVFQMLATSGLDTARLGSFVEKKLYWPLIHDSRFSPRMLKLLCSRLVKVEHSEQESFVHKALASPENLWQEAYERLSTEGQTLTLLGGMTGGYCNQQTIKEAFFPLFQKMHGKQTNKRRFERALVEVEPVFIKTRAELDTVWLSSANPGVSDFVYAELRENKTLVNALIQCLPDFSWGIDNFAVHADSHQPIHLNNTQSKQLLEKLLELLSEKSSYLMQLLETEEWSEKSVSFGQRLSQLWRKVIPDNSLAQWFYVRLEPKIPEADCWSELLREGNMATLLNLSRYQPMEKQPLIWQTALVSLLNSEDAAALAEFCVNYEPAKSFFRKKRKLKRAVLSACMDEIDSVDDTGHLDAILHDLYKIESALDADISEAKFLIYEILDELNYPDFDSEYDDEMPGAVYYTRPDPGQAYGLLQRELDRMKSGVDERFRSFLRE